MKNLGLLIVLLFCLLWMSLANNETDFTEECQPECKRNLAMVCGMDGTVNKTFDNDCFLKETNRCKNTNFTLISNEPCSAEDFVRRVGQKPL